MQGFFGQRGELYFEIDLIAVDGSVITVNALLDTGFTDWLAMNAQDAEDLGWSILGKREMLTARGDAQFNLYEGTVVWDGQELIIPVVGGQQVTEVLLGLQWLENRRLIVDRKVNLLSLEEVD
jgi:predicted aspartyl protease